jgi:hypothetical protein
MYIFIYKGICGNTLKQQQVWDVHSSFPYSGAVELVKIRSPVSHYLEAHLISCRTTHVLSRVSPPAKKTIKTCVDLLGKKMLLKHLVLNLRHLLRAAQQCFC